MIKDYIIPMTDSKGRVHELYVDGGSIDILIEGGASLSEAQESVESNAFANAIYRGQIGEDAWATGPRSH